MLVHAVFFWLKPGLTAAERTRFRAEVGKLAAIRTIDRIFIGPPAAIAERGVTDRSFDLALTSLFKDGPAHDAYQVDPVHVAFVEGNKDSWTKVQVFDSQE
jgi:hypothetical protein